MPTIEGAQGVFKAMIIKANETARAATPEAVLRAEVQRELAVQAFIQNIQEARQALCSQEVPGQVHPPRFVSYAQRCPQCSSGNVEVVGGCPLCHDCGWSRC